MWLVGEWNSTCHVVNLGFAYDAVVFSQLVCLSKSLVVRPVWQ